MLGSGLLSRVNSLTTHSNALLKTGLAQLPLAHSLTDFLTAGVTLDNQVLWMSAGLGALAVGLFITRAIREI
jgi:hypothetical protein